MLEVWKFVSGMEDSYQVSSMGSVRSIDRICTGPSGRQRRRKGALMKQTLSKGYMVVSLFSSSGKVVRRVHRLVAESFLGAPEDGAVTNHKDGNKLNNQIQNLEWTTVQGNTVHSYETGLQLGRKGVTHHNVRLSENDVISIVKKLSRGASQIALAEEFAVSLGQISLINLGKRWEHLNLSAYGSPPYGRTHRRS